MVDKYVSLSLSLSPRDSQVVAHRLLPGKLHPASSIDDWMNLKHCLQTVSVDGANNMGQVQLAIACHSAHNGTHLHPCS